MSDQLIFRYQTSQTEGGLSLVTVHTMKVETFRSLCALSTTGRTLSTKLRSWLKSRLKLISIAPYLFCPPLLSLV